VASERTRQVLDRLVAGNERRIVIFDSPPALAASPASELARHVGQTILVVRADSTSEAALRDAVSLLGACPTIRLLLNGVKFSSSGRQFGTYYGKPAS
jgi:Mrp family chromosome partitioning ATPase